MVRVVWAVMGAVLLVGCGGRDRDSDAGIDAGPGLDAGAADGGPDAGPGDGGVDAGAADGGPERWVPDSPAYRWDRWIASIGSSDDMGVAFAPSGEVTWGGAIWRDADLGGGERTVLGFQDAFVVRHDADGVYRWDRVLGVDREIEGVDLVRGVATDAAGNVYVAGSISDDYDFGGGLRTVDTQRDIFVVSYDADGAYRWDRVWGSTERDTALDVVAQPSGNVCFAGVFRYSVDFGGGTRTPSGSWAGVVVCLSSDGEYLWDRTFDGAVLRALATDPEGNLAVVGSFSEPLELEGTTHTSEGEEDVFVLSMDGEGADRWSHVWGTAGRDWPNGVTADAEGNVTLTGLFAGERDVPPGPIDFGGGARTSAGAADVFVASYDVDGVYRWDRTFGGSSWDGSEGDVAADPAGYVVVGVTTGGTAYDLGGGERTGRIAVAAYDPDGEYLWDVVPVASAPGTSDPLGTVHAVDVHPSGCVAVTGRFRGTIDFGGGERTEDYSTTIPPYLWVLGGT